MPDPLTFDLLTRADVTDVAMKFLAYVGGPAAIWRALVLARRGWIHWQGFMGEVRQGLASVKDLAPRVSSIERMVQPNGGTSLLDKVNSIDTRTRRMDARTWILTQVYSTAMFETDADGEFIAVNRAYETLTGYSCDDMRGRGWLNTVHPDDRHRVREEFESAIQERRGFRIDYRGVHRLKPDATVVRMETDLIHDESTGATIGWLGSVVCR